MRKFDYCGSQLFYNIIERRKIRVVKTPERGVTITERLIGNILYVHNGLKYFPLTITSEMVGFKLGDFIFTKRRSREIHVNNRIEAKKKKKKKKN